MTSVLYASDAASASTLRVMSDDRPNVPMMVRSASRSGYFDAVMKSTGRSGHVCVSSKLIIGWPVLMIRCSSSNARRACSAEK